jgi:hypothetical protein
MVSMSRLALKGIDNEGPVYHFVKIQQMPVGRERGRLNKTGGTAH